MANYKALLARFADPITFWTEHRQLVDAPPRSAAKRVRAQTRQCWECGRNFTYTEAQQQSGEWNEDYCGC